MENARHSQGGRSLEIIVKDELQGMLDHFAAAFDIRIALFTPSWEELLSGMQEGSCGYCRWLRGELGLDERCRRTDREKMAEAAKGSTPLLYRCHAGLMEAIQPLRLEDGELAGFIMIGQFRLEGSEPDKSILKEAGPRRERQAQARRLFEEVPSVPRRKLQHILGLFSMIVSMAVERRMLSMKGDLIAGKIERLIMERLDRNVSLAEAARHVGRSASTVSHLFKARLGVSFKRRLLELKLGAAEELLRRSPGITVSEAAARCGFASPFHFSRLFKKHRGMPPSAAKGDAAPPSPRGKKARGPSSEKRKARSKSSGNV